MIKIANDIKDIKRFNQIVRVFFEEGFGYFIYKLKFHKNIGIHTHIKKGIRKLSSDPTPIRLRKAFEKLGPTFIKLGQILSVRPDFIPKEYIKELQKLQEHTKEISYYTIKNIVESETGEKISKTFSYFGKKPIASASLSQVHKATLLTGEIVAVKIQKPDAKDLINKDLDIMFFLAHLLDKYFPKFKNYDLVNVVTEFAEWTLRELDFTQEEKNIIKFRENLKDEKVIIPNVFQKYTTSNLLIMQFEEFEHIYDHKFKNKKDKDDFVSNIINIIAKMIFEDGFFHADPHPGNLLIQGKTPLFLDFGMIGMLNDDLKSKLCNIFIVLIHKDVDKTLDLMIKLTTVQPNADIPAFKKNAGEIIKNWYGKSIGECSFIKMVYKILREGTRQGLIFPSDIILTAKSLLDAEGIGLEISPETNIIEIIKPYVERMALKQYDPIKIAEKTITEIEKNRDLYINFPEHVTNLLKKINGEGFDFHIANSDLNDIENHMDFSSNKKSLAYIIAALFLSSAFFFYIEKQIIILGLHIGYIELIIAFILLIFLFREMFKH